MSNATRETQVRADGRIEVNVPLPPGSRVEVTVRSMADFDPLTECGTLDEWDNLLDDAMWRCGV